MKKQMLMLMVFIMFAMNAMAEGKQDQTSESSPVTLRMSWWGGESRHKATLQAISEFEAANPGIKVEAEYGGFNGYYQKLITQLAAKTAPDIIQVTQMWIQELADRENKVYENIYDRQDIDIKGFSSAFLKSYCEFDNELVAIPSGLNGRLLCYNSDLARSAGIEVPEAMTWDSFYELGRELKKKSPGSYLMAADSERYRYLFRAYVMQKTGKQWVNDSEFLMGTDRDALIDAFAYFQKLLNEGIVEPMEKSMVYNGEVTMNPQWIEGNILFMEEPAALINDILTTAKFNVDITRYPIHKSAALSGVVVRPGVLFMMNGNSEYKEESARFLNWMFNDKTAVETIGVERGVPANKPALSILEQKGAISALITKSIQVIDDSDKGPISPLSQNTEIDAIYDEVLQKVGYLMITPAEGADELITKSQRKLDELKTN